MYILAGLGTISALHFRYINIKQSTSIILKL